MPRCLACESQHQELAVCCPHCGASRTVRDHARPHPDEGGQTLLGTLVGERFALVDVIGVGATGLVYEAIQTRVRRTVAVKVLRANLVADADARRRFEREAAAASRINHPNLVTLFDFATDGSRSYLAMELVDGRSLSQLAPYDALPIDVTVHLLRQLLRAMRAAHELGVVHRDLKPGNLVVVHRPGDPWFLKVLDFGLARLAGGADEALHDEAEQRAAAAGAVFGTPLYMSPEQVVAEQPVTAAADIYAWGAIAYELVCGRPPYPGDTPLVVMNRHVSSPIPALLPRDGLERLAAIEPVIARCLAKAPGERFPDAAAVLDELDACLGFAQRSTIKVPEVDEDTVLDSDLVIELEEIEGPLPREAVAQAANAAISWLHKPPTGSPRWSIPGRDEPVEATDDELDEAFNELRRHLQSKEPR